MDVREAARRTLGTGSARVRRSGFLDGEPAHPLIGALLMEEVGEVDLDRRRARLRALHSAGADRAAEWLAAKWPWLDDDIREVEADPTWSTIVTRDARYVGSGERWMLAERPSDADPTWVLDALAKGACGASRTGAEDVRGTACERWALDPVELQASPRRTLHGTVWIDADGLLRRITWMRPGFGRRRTHPKHATAKLWHTVELWDFGLPVTIEPPTAVLPDDSGPLLPVLWELGTGLWRKRRAWRRSH